MKNILNVQFHRLIRFWIDNGTAQKPHWTEMGHFFAGFEFKLTRLVETNGTKQESAGLGFEAQGTFEPAQNAFTDFADYLTLMSGVRGVAMLFGDARFSTLGKLLVLNGADRVSIVCDVPVYAQALKGSGRIAGWVPGFQLYRVDGVGATGPGLKVIESLFIEEGIAGQIDPSTLITS